MRLTRAALRAETIDSIEFDAQARIPLNEVSTNTLPEHVDLEDTQPKKMPPKKSRKGATKKAPKGKKARDVDDEQIEPQVLEDERLAAGSPASDAAADELAKGPTDGAFAVMIHRSNARSVS